MAYCTLDDLKEQIPEDELRQLTDDEDIGVIDTARTDRAISDAGAEIDGYCGGRYKVPLSPVPGIIRKFCVDIAIYNLFQRRQGAPEYREKSYENAIKFLQNVAKGVVSLGVQPPPDSPGEDEYTDGGKVSTRDKEFSPDTMAKY